tara:strand:- start:1552 stop:2196 length:645 start_codon:yes stop_codon:yes gene_type:complete
MKPKLSLKWSFNNSKLKKTNTVSFNLPAFRSADGFKVCPKAGGCATVCYARQGYYVMPSVAATREFNLAVIRKSLSSFRLALITDLQHIKQTSIRLHDSGDFFNQAYLNVWIKLAELFPEKKFYAYTKSLHLNFSGVPDNFQIIQSAGGIMDKNINPLKSHSRIFATDSDRIAAGYIDGNLNDLPAINGELKIGLVYHGSKNLKKGQISWLKAV